MGVNLFEGSTSSSSEEEDASNIKINQEFARRFDHNKRREDLQRFEELKKRGVIEHPDSTSSEESDDDLIDSDGEELQFFDALVKIKKQDPILTEKDTKLFDSDDDDNDVDDGGEGEEEKKKKKKPLYLKDVMAKQLIEEGPEFEEKRGGLPVKSYNYEQEEIRQAFLKEAKETFNGEDDDDGEFLVEKKRNVAEDDVDGDGGEEIQKRLDEYFGEDGNLSENEMFLKSFLKNKMWVDEGKDKKKDLDEKEGIDFSEDENELERQDKYESEFNFRYQEGGGDRILGHSRFVEGSVRKKTNPRKEQRKSKAERMKQAEFERQEELKHLKNVKRKEIVEKLEKIKEVAGIGEDGACTFDGDDLEEEFDPEEYDLMMKKTFNDKYYDAEDVDSGFGSDSDDEVDLEKPDFEKEDELLGLPRDWDVLKSSGGFREVRNKILKHGGEEQDAELSNGLDREEEEEEMGEGGKRKRKRKMSLKEKVALDKELEEFYKLDYEDTIGDLKTRFKYASVRPNKYGLSAAEILMTDDKELNQYVSLKKLAPFRESEWKVSKQKRYQQKMNKRLLLQGVKSNDPKKGKKQHKLKHNHGAASLVPGSEVNGQTQLEESNGQTDPTSKRSRRKRRLAEYKLSKSRLMAYGKIPSKPKRLKNN
eukprot:TRINITY_DN1568_c0_g1_i1.p1 TRINITY_DN1568_c0_g1~~TRINITY_DN1568_c0_g1_i1.p1  ORF type:complete len:648 (-),score=242.25 TRINITY_DN1568_c0_g1_i1:383-2326(-)